MDRTAKCLCGGFRAIVSGEPGMVNACHCTDCQRRSGAPFTSNAYYPTTQVRLQGERRTYRRISAVGRWLDHLFCPDCGTTVCWTSEFAPDSYGVAVGLFNDPSFPGPAISVWEETRYAWVPELPAATHLPRGRRPSTE